MAIPDHILLKPGPLNADELAVMKTHAMHGWEMLRRAAERMGDQAACSCTTAWRSRATTTSAGTAAATPTAWPARPFPLSARLMAVADVYDALISRRPYKEPFPHDEAVRRLLAGADRTLDPAAVDAMRCCEQRFIEIAQAWRD